MDREILVYVYLDGVPNLVGRLWAHTRKNKESATFQYDDGWLTNPAKFSLEHALQVGPVRFIRLPTRRYSAQSATPPPTGGAGPSFVGYTPLPGGKARTLQELDYLLPTSINRRQEASCRASTVAGLPTMCAALSMRNLFVGSMRWPLAHLRDTRKLLLRFGSCGKFDAAGQTEGA